jgi:hypothetical protein
MLGSAADSYQLTNKQTKIAGHSPTQPDVADLKLRPQ